MNAEDFIIRPQPYSRSLRSIARLIEARESDAACVEEIRIFLLRSGIPVEDHPVDRDR